MEGRNRAYSALSIGSQTCRLLSIRVNRDGIMVMLAPEIVVSSKYVRSDHREKDRKQCGGHRECRNLTEKANTRYFNHEF